MRIVVVVPTFNEAENVAELIDAIVGQEPAMDVLVVDDSSPDGTSDVVSAASARLGERVRLLRRPVREGLAAAYRDGFQLALDLSYDVIVQMDADGSHPVAAIALLVRAVEDGADLALGARYLPGGGVDTDWAWYRRALSRGGNAYARRMLGVPYRDLTGGFKAWTARLLKQVQPVGGGLSGYGFQIHATLCAHRSGARVVEVPFVFRDRARGRSKMSTRIAAEALVAVVRMRHGRAARFPHAP